MAATRAGGRLVRGLLLLPHSFPAFRFAQYGLRKVFLKMDRRVKPGDDAERAAADQPNLLSSPGGKPMSSVFSFFLGACPDTFLGALFGSTPSGATPRFRFACCCP